MSRLWGVTLALLLGSIVTLPSTARGEPRGEPRIGDVAPALALPAADGTTFTLAATGSAPLVVDFYATWCGPCHEAIAALGRIGKVLGVRLVIVDVGEEPAQVMAHVREHPLPDGAQLVFDRDGAASRSWGQHRFPTTFLLDGGLRIRHINRGFGSGYEARLRGWLGAMRGR